MLKDTFGRVHNYLRISLTDKCNLRCSYCMPNETYHFLPNKRLMQKQEVVDIASHFVFLGVKKIRLTGGEPFVRKDTPDILHELSKLPVELAITTNATRIHNCFSVFEKIPFYSVNVSLDTLNRQRFLEMTKRDLFEQVKANIERLTQYNQNVKVNVVLMRGINSDEIIDFLEWSIKYSIQIRFIEFMPFQGNKWEKEKIVTAAEILATIKKPILSNKLKRRLIALRWNIVWKITKCLLVSLAQ